MSNLVHKRRLLGSESKAGQPLLLLAAKLDPFRKTTGGKRRRPDKSTQKAAHGVLSP